MPEINDRYFKALLANDLVAARKVIEDWDLPLWEMGRKYVGDRQTAWRGVFEIMGISQRYRRAPMPSATEADMEKLRADVQALGIN